jgi:ATP-binding cassette, subfamily B, multidrug efflux pump
MEQSPLPKADMRWLAGYVGRHRGAAVGALATGVVAGAAVALEPYLAGIVIDAIRTGGDVLSPILLMLALGAVGVVAFFRQRYYSGVVAYMVTYDIRKTLFENLLTREHAFFLEHPTGDLISRMRADIDVIWRLLALTFTRFGSAAFSLVLTFILLATISLPLTLVVFVVLMVSSAFQARAGVRLARIFEDVQTQEGALAAFAQDAFSGIQTIKTFGREAGAAAHYAAANDRYRRTWLYFRRRNEPVGMLPNAIAELTAGIVVLAGGVLTLNGSLTLGDFARFLISLNLISVVLLQLGTIYQRAQQARGALARLTPLLQPAQIQDMDLNTEGTKEHEGEREEFNAEAQKHRDTEKELEHGGTEETEITEGNGVGAEIFYGAITFERVGVRASARDSLPPTIRERMALNTHDVVQEGEESWLLRDVSLHIPAGAVVGFVGATGSGKTLLLSLLARVLDPDEGRVLLDGRDVRTLPLDDLRGAIAYVPQTTFLFSMPLRENVRLGNLSLEDDLLERALHISRMSNDLPQLPQGLETLVGEKGVMLSGGQKQRVAIARAIVRDPAVLVLDDALSSVDTQTAADILADLRQVLRSRTSLIVAHRMATVKDADLIVVMQKGRIVEQGTHAALLAREGIYAQMWQREAEEV